MTRFINPFQLSSLQWLGTYIINRFGLWNIDFVTKNITKNKNILFNKHITSELTVKDKLYLFCNSITETIFLHKICYIVSSKHIIDLNILKTIICFYILFYLDDIGYIILHKLMHYFYTFHQHHHIMKIPYRGYIDAGNENPIEMILALINHYYMIYYLNKFINVPTISIFSHLFVKAIGSCINHINRDIKINIGLGVVISSEFHQIHHLYNIHNYSQFCPLLDEFFCNIEYFCMLLRT